MHDAMVSRVLKWTCVVVLEHYFKRLQSLYELLALFRHDIVDMLQPLDVICGFP